MSSLEPRTNPGLPTSAKVVVGVLAVFGALSVLRWLFSGLMTLLTIAVVLAVVYAVVKVLVRR